MLPFPSNPFVFLWRYAMRNKVLFFSICASCVVMVISQKLSPWFFSKMVGLFGENVKFADIADSIWWLLAAVVGTTILAKIMFVLFNLLTEVVLRPRVFEQMSADCFQYINGHSLSYFSDNMAGSLAQKSNALSDTASFYQTSLYYISDVLRLIVVFVMLALVNVSFSLYFVAFMLVSVAVLLKVGKLSMNLRAEMTEAKSKVSGEMIDAMQNHFFVRLFNGYKHEQKRVDKVLQDETDKTNKSVNIEVLQSEGEKIYFHFVYLSFVFYALVLWKDKTITTADVVLIFFLLQDVAAGVSWLIHRTIIYSSIFSEMRTNLIPFSTPHEIVDVENAEILKVKEGIVELKDVCFAYKDNKPLFNHFNLQIPAGQKVGVVGMSGGGKSTLINLLQRFYDVQGGEILIDGQNIKNVTQESLHKQIGYVPQTSALLERSIAENIAYGKPNAKREDIRQAAVEAFADKFIEELPNDYQTILNAQNQLSGGQMQRLSIARALLKDAPILILDEATSALDSESEFYIQKAIENMLKDKTVIAVAHRLSTLKNMDRIIVLEKGKIVEDGKLDDLLKKKGKFWQYWNLQKLKGEKNEQ